MEIPPWGDHFPCGRGKAQGVSPGGEHGAVPGARRAVPGRKKGVSNRRVS